MTIIAFVTGTLAAPALREVVAELEATAKIRATVVVLKIEVAALMTAEWVTRKLSLPGDVKFDRVILPGYCKGDLAPLSAKLGVPVERGPKDLQDLPEHFGKERRAAQGYGKHDIEILAEINDAARLPVQRVIELAEAYRRDGADVIDIGCDPQPPGFDRPAWKEVGAVVRELRGRGMRVSVDSFHPDEVRDATRAGAELVLSVNSTNREIAADWGAQVVVIPDDVKTLGGLDETIAHLENRRVPYRIDPIVEPIGLGFAASLGRYLEVRRRYPQAAMMMGIGNLTEMTEVDSAGVNALLVGFCEELSIGSVLTTQVINWARSSVREIDAARRLMHFAATRRRLPKHVDPSLVMLRDPRLRGPGGQRLEELAASLRDKNVRLFVADGKLHAMNKHFHVAGDDPFDLFERMTADAKRAEGIDAPHAFYLGYELAKAVTALTLGKNYTQDQALRWGMLTREEVSAHERRKTKRKQEASPQADAGSAKGDA